MKHISVIAFAIFALATVSACSKGGSEIKTGTSVMAKWSDSWYKATITGKEGGKFMVNYADGTSGTVSANEMTLLQADPNLQKGNAVWALWGAARFYSGVVEEVQADGYLVKWDDGSEASVVKKGDIVKK